MKSVFWASVVSLALLWPLGASPAGRSSPIDPDGARGEPIVVGERNLQAVLDTAPDHARVLCDPNHRYVLSAPLRITRPLTLSGLNARLPERLGRTSLLIVEAEGVTVRDFTLEGNASSVSQLDRAALLVVQSSRFVIENGTLLSSSKDGINVTPSRRGGTFRSGLIRNIVGRGNVRDLISIQGLGEQGREVGDLLVENIQAFDSERRGAVEVSDGSTNVTVRKVYAERCVYGVDVQDHSQPGQVNRNVVIDGLTVRNCETALRMANRDLGHTDLVVRNVVGDRFRPSERRQALQVRNTRNVLIDGVSLKGCVTEPAVLIQNCDNVAVRNMTITTTPGAHRTVVLEDLHDARVDGLTFQGEDAAPGLVYRVASGEAFEHLQVHNVTARGGRPAGILLENTSQGGSLDHYIITGNFATVVDRIKGPHSVIRDNLP